MNLDLELKTLIDNISGVIQDNFDNVAEVSQDERAVWGQVLQLWKRCFQKPHTTYDSNRRVVELYEFNKDLQRRILSVRTNETRAVANKLGVDIKDFDYDSD